MKNLIFNPYLPSYEYIPDGEPHVFDDRLYIFGSHDRFGGNDFCLNDYVAWSAPVSDLSEWNYEGIIYRKAQDPRSKGEIPLFAPDVCKGTDGRYYLYYSIKDSSIISVAVCDTPAGKYQYYGDVKTSGGRVYGTKTSDYFDFDPAVLVDDDGKVYLYSGFGNKRKINGHPCVGAFVRELDSDMLTGKTQPKIILPKKSMCFFRNAFFEGSSIRKINGLYFFVYPSTNMSGLNYCTSQYPDRDFKYRGCIHSTSDIGLNGHSFLNAAYPIGNNHGGIAEINGKYYIFDHRMTNSTMFSRQGVAEEIKISREGKIEQVECTSYGLYGGPLPAKTKYPAYIACNLMSKRKLGIRVPFSGAYITQEGGDREDNPNQYICNISDGTVIGYKYFHFEGSENSISVEIRGRAKGKIFVYNSEKKGDCVAIISIPYLSSNWNVFSSKLSKLYGKQGLFLKFKGKGRLDMLSFKISNIFS